MILIVLDELMLQQHIIKQKKKFINIKQFIIKNFHGRDYNNHVFIINQQINRDIKNNNIDRDK